MDTKGHCFPKSFIIQSVYLKLRFTLSYRDVEEIMRIRGVEVDHATIQRWVFKIMPEIEIQMRQRKKIVGKRWRMDET
jgi:putative transposase